MASPLLYASPVGRAAHPVAPNRRLDALSAACAPISRTNSTRPEQTGTDDASGGPPWRGGGTPLSSALVGLEAHRIRVEVTCARGPGFFTRVGLPEATVRETRVRVLSDREAGDSV